MKFFNNIITAYQFLLSLVFNNNFGSGCSSACLALFLGGRFCNFSFKYDTNFMWRGWSGGGGGGGGSNSGRILQFFNYGFRCQICLKCGNHPHRSIFGARLFARKNMRADVWSAFYDRYLFCSLRCTKRLLRKNIFTLLFFANRHRWRCRCRCRCRCGHWCRNRWRWRRRKRRSAPDPLAYIYIWKGGSYAIKS